MNHLKKLLDQTHISADQLALSMGMTIRAINYHYTTGRMPFALIYKLHLVTGLPIATIVPKHLAEEWLFLFEELLRTNKPKGGGKIWKAKKKKPTPAATEWSKNLELTEPPAGQAPEEKAPDWVKKHKSVTTKPASTTFHVEPIPKTVTTTDTKEVKSTLPKTVTITPKRRGSGSIADLMKAAPPAPAIEEPTPDFSNIDDSVFSTSADQVASRSKR